MRFEVGDTEGGGARSTAVTSDNYGRLCVYVCIYVCAGEVHPPPPSRVSNRVHRDSWVQEIPCNSNSLNSYAVRLFSIVTSRCSPRPSVYVSLPSLHVSRDSILSVSPHPHGAVQFGSVRTDYNRDIFPSLSSRD